MKKRYKIRKEQLERVVESFVMESASPNTKGNNRVTLTEEEEALIAESKQSIMSALKGKVAQYVKGGYITQPTEDEMNDFMSKAEADDWGGEISFTGVEWVMKRVKTGGKVRERKMPKAPGKLAYKPIGGSYVKSHGAGNIAKW